MSSSLIEDNDRDSLSSYTRLEAEVARPAATAVLNRLTHMLRKTKKSAHAKSAKQFILVRYSHFFRNLQGLPMVNVWQISNAGMGFMPRIPLGREAALPLLKQLKKHTRDHCRPYDSCHVWSHCRHQGVYLPIGLF
jgi:hypothetical protein